MTNVILYQFIMPPTMISPSPYCVKAEVLLKLAGINYTSEAWPGELSEAPKGKLPVIKDGDDLVADSEFIRHHLAKKHGIDWNADLTPEQTGTGLALSRMLEHHTMLGILHSRWVDERYWPTTKGMFFNNMPEGIAEDVQDRLKANLVSQGIGQHTQEEIYNIILSDLEAASGILGDKMFFAGDKPTWVDAILYGTCASFYAAPWGTELQKRAETFENLKAYTERCTALWFPAASNQAAAE